jgi:hypothetical protein
LWWRDSSSRSSSAISRPLNASHAHSDSGTPDNSVERQFPLPRIYNYQHWLCCIYSFATMRGSNRIQPRGRMWALAIGFLLQAVGPLVLAGGADKKESHRLVLREPASLSAHTASHAVSRTAGSTCRV